MRKVPRRKEVPQEEKLEIELDVFSEPVGMPAFQPVIDDMIVPVLFKPGLTKREGNCSHHRFL